MIRVELRRYVEGLIRAGTSGRVRLCVLRGSFRFSVGRGVDLVLLRRKVCARRRGSKGFHTVAIGGIYVDVISSRGEKVAFMSSSNAVTVIYFRGSSSSDILRRVRRLSSILGSRFRCGPGVAIKDTIRKFRGLMVSCGSTECLLRRRGGGVRSVVRAVKTRGGGGVF